MLFSGEIQNFNNRIDAIEKMILKTHEGIHEILKTFAKQSDAYQEAMKMFGCCAKAFEQVREACECLREELSEASGTLVESTYND